MDNMVKVFIFKYIFVVFCFFMNCDMMRKMVMVMIMSWKIVLGYIVLIDFLVELMIILFSFFFGYGLMVFFIFVF